MLPRVTPETRYDHNGQPHKRYTGVWATRPLGSQQHLPDETPKHWEPKNNTSGASVIFLFIAIFELCCALAFTFLGIYHWVKPGELYPLETAADLVMTGLASSWLAVITVIALWPQRSGRIAKRMMLVFSVPVLSQLITAIATISQPLAVQAYFNANVKGFHVAEVILASILVICVVVTLYPASEACVPAERQRHVAIRAITLCLNTTVGAVILIYLCFAIYGVHAAFEPDPGSFRVEVVLSLSIAAIPSTGLILSVTLGSYYAIGRNIRAHMIPYAVVGVVVLMEFLFATHNYVVYLNKFMLKDWHDNAFVAMFALNCMSIVGVAIMVALSMIFAYL